MYFCDVFGYCFCTVSRLRDQLLTWLDSTWICERCTVFDPLHWWSSTPQLNLFEIAHVGATFVPFPDFATSCSLDLIQHEFVNGVPVFLYWTNEVRTFTNSVRLNLGEQLKKDISCFMNCLRIFVACFIDDFCTVSRLRDQLLTWLDSTFIKSRTMVLDFHPFP